MELDLGLARRGGHTPRTVFICRHSENRPNKQHYNGHHRLSAAAADADAVRFVCVCVYACNRYNIALPRRVCIPRTYDTPAAPLRHKRDRVPEIVWDPFFFLMSIRTFQCRTRSAGLRLAFFYLFFRFIPTVYVHIIIIRISISI